MECKGKGRRDEDSRRQRGDRNRTGRGEADRGTRSGVFSRLCLRRDEGRGEAADFLMESPMEKRGGSHCRG